MTDSRLRSLQRSASTGGDPIDRSRLLVARMRSGELSLERVELAAYCGDEAARAAVGPDRLRWLLLAAISGRADAYVTSDSRVEPFDEWVRGLSRWGPEIQVRAAVAAARVALPVWCDSTRLSGRTGLHAERVAREGTCGRCTTGDLRDARPGDSIRMVEEWLACPCDDHVALAERACEIGPRMRFVTSLRHAFNALGRDHYVPDAILDSAEIAGEQPVRPAVQTSLITWALGGSP